MCGTCPTKESHPKHYISVSRRGSNYMPRRFISTDSPSITSGGAVVRFTEESSGRTFTFVNHDVEIIEATTDPWVKAS